MPLDCSIIIAQAKMFHEHLGLAMEFGYSLGWFSKFKKIHGLRIINICGDKASAKNESAKSYSKEFSNIISHGQ